MKIIDKIVIPLRLNFAKLIEKFYIINLCLKHCSCSYCKIIFTTSCNIHVNYFNPGSANSLKHCTQRGVVFLVLYVRSVQN